MIKGSHHTEETKIKISQSETGKIVSLEARRALSRSLKGKPKPSFTDEHRANISRAARNRKMAPKKVSYIESLVGISLRTLGIWIEPQYEIDGFTFDYVLPELGMVVEVNGCYWHACKMCGHKDRKGIRGRDAQKREKVERAGLDFRIIWEHELRDDILGPVMAAVA